MKRIKRLAFFLALALMILNINPVYAEAGISAYPLAAEAANAQDSGASLSSSLNEIARVSENGAVIGIVLAKEKVDISDYFDSYLDIKYYKIDSSDKKIASVTKSGILKGKNAGTATIRAYSSKKTEIANRKVIVEKPELRLPYIFDLTESCNAADYLTGTTISPNLYSSSKPTVASIDYESGEISVHKKGKTKITAVFSGKDAIVKVSCTLKVRTGKPDMRTYVVDTGNGETKKIKGYFDVAMAKKLYNLVDDYRKQLSSDEDYENVLPFSHYHAYDDDSASQNALNTVAETRALEAAVLFSHIRPNETSYYTAYNQDVLLNRNYEAIGVGSALTGEYAGEDMVGGKNYDSAVNAFTAIKSYNTSMMSNEYFDGLGVAVFVTNNKTKLTNGTKQQLKYHIVLNYIGPKKPSSKSLSLDAEEGVMLSGR